MRPTLFSGIDRTFASVLAGFLMVELTGAVALAQRPVLALDDIELETLIDPLRPQRSTAAWAAKIEPLRSAPAAAPPKLAGASNPTPVPKPATAADLRDTVRRLAAPLAMLTARGADLSHAVDTAIGSTSVEPADQRSHQGRAWSPGARQRPERAQGQWQRRRRVRASADGGWRHGAAA